MGRAPRRVGTGACGAAASGGCPRTPGGVAGSAGDRKIEVNENEVAEMR